MAELCSGKFECLRPFVQHLTLDDLRLLKSDEFADTIARANPTLRLIALVFYRQHVDTPPLQPISSDTPPPQPISSDTPLPPVVDDFTNNDNSSDSSSSNDSDDSDDSDDVKTVELTPRYDEYHESLSFAGVLVSERFMSEQLGTVSPMHSDRIGDIFVYTKIPSRVLSIRISQWISNKGTSNTIRQLDLSRNHLFNEDLAYVFEAVAEMKTCHTVIVANNHLTAGHSAFLHALLRLPHVRHVDITQNPLASMTSVDVPKVLLETALSKLVWLTVPQFTALATHPLVQCDTQDTMRRVIEETHLSYWNKASVEK
jgi:hypothetical protein